MLDRLQSSSRGRVATFTRASERWIDRPLSRFERASLGIIFLIPILVNAIALWPELAIAVPSTNDDMLHFLFIQRASDAVANGESILDFWIPNIEAGFPQFFYYQHLPALATVGIQRLTFGELDLLTTMNLIRYVLLVGFPLTVLLSLRWIGFPWVVAVMGATASSLLAGFGRYGFDYDSYVWRGWGCTPSSGPCTWRS